MINERNEWRELPFRGEVRELTTVGSGKDRTLQVRVPDGRGFGIPLSYYGGRTNVTCCDGIVVTTAAVDDVSIAVCFRPQAGWRMRIARAALNYSGSDEAWASDCAVWERMSTAKWPRESSWAVDAIDIESLHWST
jgi:hypothetical protein